MSFRPQDLHNRTEQRFRLPRSHYRRTIFEFPPSLRATPRHHWHGVLEFPNVATQDPVVITRLGFGTDHR